MRIKQLGKYIIEFYLTIAIPLIYLLGLGIIASGEGREGDLGREGGGLLVAIAGIVVWGMAYVHLGRHFGVLPKTQVRLKSGLYHYFKHPMYMGIMATYLGLAIARGSTDGVWYSLGILGPMLLYRARKEEQKLKD